jgi:uncharacterized SAM-binding protein YcdF (DUF218 family)
MTGSRLGRLPAARACGQALALFVLLLAAGAAVWYGREALLRGAAQLWIVSDTIGDADAVVVLGGGMPTRPFAAAEYYRRGMVKKVLVSDARRDKTEMLGALPSHTALNRAVLLKLGVPEGAIETFGDELSNTYEEAVALREWAVKSHAGTIIVPTEIFPSRRIRWVLERELAGTVTKVEVPAWDEAEYTRSEWWRDERGVIAFQNEIIKYIYYRLKY